MNSKLILVAAPLLLAMAGCSPSQKTYGGPIVPIYSPPLIPAWQVSTAPEQHCTCTGARRRHMRRPVRIVSRSAPANPLRYPHVLTDPIDEEQPPHKVGKPAFEAKSSSGEPSGDWKVVGGGLSACVLHLSRQGLVDIYKAGTSGCVGGKLGTASGWRQAGKSVEVLQPGGQILETFTPSASGSMEGTPDSSGQVLKLTR